MQIWYNATTKEVKAIYSHVYNGSIWSDAGFVAYEDARTRIIPKLIIPGAIIDFDGNGEPFVVTPAPEPPAPAPGPDFKKEYKEATTDSARLNILARATGLAT